MIENGSRTAAGFARFLFQGIWVDRLHTCVVLLVISGLFSTPLLLGSIRNRSYVAHKEQVKRENRGDELLIYQSDPNIGTVLDQALVDRLAETHPFLRFVGNDKLTVTLRGPQGSHFGTLETLVPGDPRSEYFGITPPIPADFGLGDLIVSNDLGERLFGSDWSGYWAGTEFDGPPVELRFNDRQVQGEFRIVARRTAPGFGIYVARVVGSELKRAAVGLGSGRLGLPPEPTLVRHALPKVEAEQCLAVVDRDGSCDDSSKEGMIQRMRDLGLRVDQDEDLFGIQLTKSGHLRVGLTQSRIRAGAVVFRPVAGDCQAALAHLVVPRCEQAVIIPLLEWSDREREGSVAPETDGGADLPFYRIVGLTRELYELLPGVRELLDVEGGVAIGSLMAMEARPVQAGELPLLVAKGAGLPLGSEFRIPAGNEALTARVSAFYDCDGPECPAFADVLGVSRLQALETGRIQIARASGRADFVPREADVEFDQVLVYVPRLEDVKPVAERLENELPGFSVDYNAAALQRLQRQQGRMSLLFEAVLLLSGLFILLSIGALAILNVRRRTRQIAQMLVLGYTKAYVGMLIVAEYAALTVVGSAFAGLTCAAFFRMIRSVLVRDTAVGGGDDFVRIVQSMVVDGRAFALVMSLVLACTLTVAAYCARRASKADPVTLLD